MGDALFIERYLMNYKYGCGCVAISGMAEIVTGMAGRIGCSYWNVGGIRSPN